MSRCGLYPESGKLSDEEEWSQESAAWNSSSHQLAVRPHAAVTCLSDDECLTTADGQRTGQRCHWLYDGCSTGLCTCDPVRQRRQQPSGKCLTGRYISRRGPSQGHRRAFRHACLRREGGVNIWMNLR